jgi:hypothetical protein
MSLSALAAKVAPTNAAATKNVIECFMVLTPRGSTNCRVVNAPFSTSVPNKDGRQQERSNSGNVIFRTALVSGSNLDTRLLGPG